MNVDKNNKKIMVVFGTRPEAIKMCPLIKTLKTHDSFQVVICVTGQHKELLKQSLDAFDIVPEYNLDIMKERQTLFDITTEIMDGIKKILQTEKPDIVLVHGDTSTAFTTALSCFYLKIPVGHVEAGLRTYDTYSPYPEEFNRQAIGLVAQYHFSPTKKAAENLLNEGKKVDSVFVTGNTVIDSLKYTVRKDYEHIEIEWAKGSRLIMLTAHRRENLGEPMLHMFQAINRIKNKFNDIKIIYPIHKNPAVREAAEATFGDSDRIHIIEPLDVVDFHNFLAKSYMILTDSGGIQEEATALGKPVLVMRDTTERPEGIEAGTLRLVGTDEESIYENFRELLENREVYDSMSRKCNMYGDGFASEKIADILKERIFRNQ